MKITLATPSRGLIHSRTVESLFMGASALIGSGAQVSISLSHDRPIPDAHNYCVEAALKDGSDLVIFVEEDMYLDLQTYVELAKSESPITTVEYNDKNGEAGIIHYDAEGEVQWCGLGATAIKKEVFEAVGEPYFSTERRYKIKGTELEPIENPGSPWSYGGLDVDFFIRAKAKGFKIAVLKDHKAKHFKINKLGEDHTNQGVHDISEV